MDNPPALDAPPVVADSFQEARALGDGALSKVFRGERDGKVIAIKTLKRPNVKRDCDNLIREANILIKLDHPHIIKIFPFDESTLIKRGMEMEYAQNGDLLEYIIKQEDDWYPDSAFCLSVLLRIIEGLLYLHQHYLIHADIKAENILLDKDLQPKIADFDHAAQLEGGVTEYKTRELLGTACYLAPECFVSELVPGALNTYSDKSDLFAFAHLIVMLYTKNDAFPAYPVDLTSREMFISIQQGERGHLCTVNNESVKKLVLQLWDADPIKRPATAQVEEEIRHVCNSPGSS